MAEDEKICKEHVTYRNVRTEERFFLSIFFILYYRVLLNGATVMEVIATSTPIPQEPHITIVDMVTPFMTGTSTFKRYFQRFLTNYSVAQTEKAPT